VIIRWDKQGDVLIHRDHRRDVRLYGVTPPRLSALATKLMVEGWPPAKIRERLPKRR
jgi:hypothetical protein